MLSMHLTMRLRRLRFVREQLFLALAAQNIKAIGTRAGNLSLDFLGYDANGTPTIQTLAG